MAWENCNLLAVTLEILKNWWGLSLTSYLCNSAHDLATHKHSLHPNFIFQGDTGKLTKITKLLTKIILNPLMRLIVKKSLYVNFIYTTRAIEPIDIE